MSSNAVEQIKDRLNAVEVIGSYLKLDKAGVNYKARCPFHNERTPSFTVSPSRGTFYCFGCHAKGDIFTFVQEFEGLDFKGALKVLAERANVTLEYSNPLAKEENDRLYSALELARSHFVSNLLEASEARSYLKGRGVTDATLREWGIGWAKDEWRALYDHLKAHRVTDEEIERTGLVKRKDESLQSRHGRDSHVPYYDTFRGRIMFPIFDSSGRTVGFSGRTLSGDPSIPKYINSPETALFNKSELLYGLHAAKGAIRKKGYSILVEGQMDLIMCHQERFTNTVASSGTALTQGHVERLKKLSPRIIMAFDSDDAGVAAAEKNAKLALSLGMEVKIADLSLGSGKAGGSESRELKDPADLLLSNPPAWVNAIKNSKHIVDFELGRLMRENSDHRKMALELRMKVLPFIRELPSKIEQSHYVAEASKQTGIREEAVWEDLKVSEMKGAAENIYEAKAPKTAKDPAPPHVFSLEKRIMGIIYWKPELEDFKNKVIEACGEEKFIAMKEAALPHAIELVYETEKYYEGKDILEKDLHELILSLERASLSEEIRRLKEKLTHTESDNDILREIQKLSKRLDEVKKIQSG